MITADEFTDELVNNIKTRSTDAFRKRYEAYDYLLFDDLQSLYGRCTSQEEFARLFPDPLCCKGKTIIMTSNMNNHSGLSEQIKNILNQSIHVKLQPPTQSEVQRAINKLKLQRHLVLSNEIIQLLNNTKFTNYYMIYGVINQLEFLIQIKGQLSLEDCHKAISSII